MHLVVACEYFSVMLLLRCFFSRCCVHIMLSPFITPNLKFVEYVKKSSLKCTSHSLLIFTFCLLHCPYSFIIFIRRARASVCICMACWCWCWCWCFGLLLFFLFIFFFRSQWARFVLHYFCIVWEFSLELRMFFSSSPSLLIAVVIELK